MKVVHYEKLASDLAEGFPAIVYLTADGQALTSPIVKIFDCGTFRTRNTEYRQARKPNA